MSATRDNEIIPVSLLDIKTVMERDKKAFTSIFTTSRKLGITEHYLRMILDHFGLKFSPTKNFGPFEDIKYFKTMSLAEVRALENADRPLISLFCTTSNARKTYVHISNTTHAILDTKTRPQPTPASAPKGFSWQEIVKELDKNSDNNKPFTHFIQEKDFISTLPDTKYAKEEEELEHYFKEEKEKEQNSALKQFLQKDNSPVHWGKANFLFTHSESADVIPFHSTQPRKKRRL